MYTCKICDKDYSSEHFLKNHGVCVLCASSLEAKTKVLEELIPEILGKANNATDPDSKIMYLKTILDFLYEYKVSYYDKGVNILTEDIEDMIDTIIEGISYARL